ncbi:hypothetical protein C8Q78DRAFT_971990 [Trametes maxima]|nr:hypothetical protein C8Q78DRAFT_971990 [Trametes maxima]
MASNSATAATFKQRGNELFKSGQFVGACELYAKAEKADPADPVYPSNLSAALYEARDYAGCVAAVLRSWKLLSTQQEPKRDLVLRLSSRLAKALCLAVRADPGSRSVFESREADIEGLRSFCFKSTYSVGASSEEISRIWEDWETAKGELADSLRKGSACSSALSRLPLFMKPLDDAKEYYSIGHDPIIDLTAGWGEDSGKNPLNIDRLSSEKLSRISFLYGGVGDGRHALGTVAGLYQAYKKLPGSKKSVFRAHLTLLDIHPTAITRDLCMLMLLHELKNATDPLARAEIKATLMYCFCGAVMPGYCYDRLMQVVDDLTTRLSSSPPSIPDFLHVEANSICPVLDALDYWRRTQKPTRTMLECHQYSDPHEQWAARDMAIRGGGERSGLQSELRDRFTEQRSQIETMFRTLPENQLLQLPWMPPEIRTGRDARKFVDSNMDMLVNMIQQMSTTGRVPTHEQAFYEGVKVFFPPPELWGRHPGFKQAWETFMGGEDISRATERKISAHIEKEWKTNITLFDSSYSDPRYHPGGDGYPNMTGDVFEPVGIVDEFSRRGEPSKDSPVTNEVTSTAWNAFNVFLEEVAAALKGLYGHLTLEFITGGLSEELAKMRYKGDITRPATFPREYTRMWLSNVPDYTHGPMNMAIYVVPNLQDDPQAGASCNCLLNTGSWVSDDQYFYTYSQLISKDVPRFLGCRVIKSQAVMEALVLGALPLPRPLSELATREELTTWLTRVLFNMLIPGRSRPSPGNVRLPHTLVAFFGLLMHLHRVGFPAHWLSEFLARVLSGSMVSDIAPYADIWPIPLEDMHRRVSSRRVRVDPWLVEFENIIATAYYAIPFPIAGILPAEFSRDLEDIHVWEVKVVATYPFSAVWGPMMDNASPYEPVTRLLFYKPSEVSPGRLIPGIRDVFEGRPSPAPGAFFVLTAQELVQFEKRIRFRLSHRRVERMRAEKWSMLAYRQDSGQQGKCYPRCSS